MCNFCLISPRTGLAREISGYWIFILAYLESLLGCDETHDCREFVIITVTIAILIAQREISVFPSIAILKLYHKCLTNELRTTYNEAADSTPSRRSHCDPIPRFLDESNMATLTSHRNFGIGLALTSQVNYVSRAIASGRFVYLIFHRYCEYCECLKNEIDR